MPISETSVFLAACELYRAAVELAVTEIRILNDHFRAHALRILEHISTAEVANDRRGRAHSLHYARISKAKLRAVVEAAFIDKLIDDEKRRELSALMEHLDDEIHRFLWPPKPASPGSGSPPPEGGAAPSMESAPILDASTDASADAAPADAAPADASIDAGSEDASIDASSAASSNESSNVSSNAPRDPSSDAAPAARVLTSNEATELHQPTVWVEPATASESERIPSG